MFPPFALLQHEELPATKLLVLGTAESGKSTLLKQIKRMYGVTHACGGGRGGGLPVVSPAPPSLTRPRLISIRQVKRLEAGWSAEEGRRSRPFRVVPLMSLLPKPRPRPPTHCRLASKRRNVCVRSSKCPGGRQG
eukprot:scaffold18040_cov107-Isochrysis_galbana.AAC.1